MKAVIMAGGEGRRLRAVSGGIPKPLVPLLGKPIMEHITELLKKHGFSDICVSLGYRAGDIMDYFGDGSRFGVKFSYFTEDRPMGTAGGVKNCSSFFGEEDFLVISGDAVCDFDLSSLVKAYRESGACAALALCRSKEPLRYGLAVRDEKGYIRSFIEKPCWQRVVSDLVNTGIYVLSPRAMELVPEGQSFDFAKDLFPLMLQKGLPLLGCAMEGFWCDVGTPLAYYKCCTDALEGRINLKVPEAFIPPLQSEDEKPEAPGSQMLEYSCRDRAALMSALSSAFLEMNADYSDGIRLSGNNYSLHISPVPARSALRIAVNSADTEYAKELALSAAELASALDL